MIIGYDAKRIVANSTGLGSYGRTLINSLSTAATDHRLRLYAPDEGNDQLRSQVEMRKNVEFVYPKSSIIPFYKQYWRSRAMVKQLKADGVELFHGLSGELPAGLKKAGIKSVVTIHDLIFLRHPEYYKPIDVAIYRRKFHATLREADRIIAISECTKRDILHYGNFPEDRIDVIYQSCGTRFAQHESDSRMQEVHARYSLPARYILNVGTIEERKNVMLAVKALPLLPEDLHLVVVGRPTAYTRKVVAYAEANHLSHRLHLLHGIPNADLPSIYQMAECFVYPSRYEGFGIPVIEAIQCGLPVVAATGSCLEEAGGPDSLYVDPDDASAMAHAIEQSLKGSGACEERIARCRDYVTRFENNDIARQMFAEYCKVMTT